MAMIKIRKEQMAVFAEIAARQFEDGMVEYIQGAFPKAYGDLKELRIREIIRVGWDKAQSYGLKSERGVRVYVSLMFLLGSGFDMDQQLPWAKQVLQDESMTKESWKIDELYDVSMSYYRRVAGAEGENYDAALKKILYENINELPNTKIEPGESLRRFELRMNERLRRIFPEKYEDLKADGINQLIRTGIESAETYGITAERGLALYILLMYVLGSGFDTDLKYPWIHEILNDKGITNQVNKIDKLHNTEMELLEKRFS
jgi:hypothetical protein